MTSATPHIPTLTTDRLVLRAPAPRDVPAFAAFYRSEASRFVGGPMTEAETWRYLCQVLGHWTMRGYGRWIVTTRDDDIAIGLVGLHNPLDWPEAEVGWYIWSDNGKGYATEAGRAARAYAYETLGWTTLVSMIATGNDASVRVATALGATRQDDYHHPVYGAMGVYRHPGPQEIAT
ncbi:MULTISPECIES: GNAT family N-acetyltransferase [Roseobacteraceae]|uniref:Acetyltransferase (GNAT) domain protein n=1 Tax=Pseudosulfitobacter pseudonitzschiae TaxID=1402135 RepID=A0A221K3R4_9RHOB|nr:MULTISPECIES: GNAT family N-acetyltransferase [Roseobacteraceae]ASM73510.1 acetyltransferase (GNAT) domain protein [Pseudosulfitobacter pseudonitzschiae]